MTTIFSLAFSANANATMLSVDDVLEGLSEAQLESIDNSLASSMASKNAAEPTCGDSCFTSVKAMYSLDGGQTFLQDPNKFACYWWKNPAPGSTDAGKALNARLNNAHGSAVCRLDPTVQDYGKEKIQTHVYWDIDMTQWVAYTLSLAPENSGQTISLKYKQFKLQPEGEQLTVCNPDMDVVGWSEDPSGQGYLKGEYIAEWDLLNPVYGKKSLHEASVYPAHFYSTKDTAKAVNCAGGGGIKIYFDYAPS
jgi:hypothetical protein